MITKEKDLLSDTSKAIEYEWLETNGLGGWSSSSIVGVNTRRYHGLLVAAIVPPVERMVLLSKLDETIIQNEERFELGSNIYADNIIHPNGNKYLSNFTKNFYPEWTYETPCIRLKKKIIMIHGKNTVVVSYEVEKASSPFTIEWLPLVAARKYHALGKERAQLNSSADFAAGTFHCKPDNITDLYITIPGATYSHHPQWFYNFQYPVEQYRGLDYTEDLLNHGIFSMELKEGDRISLIISTEDPTKDDGLSLIAKEISRRKHLIAGKSSNELIQQLTLAADQFIVKRDDHLKTVIAGYHWFTDWGRDTMISLPGLCLSTGRFEDAKKILQAFAASVSRGMLPNRFQDNAEPPEYNNVDGTLWYFIAIYKYVLATGDWNFVLNEILPVLKDIIDYHFKGTRYNIKVDSDGLLNAGEHGQQLTWMDAKVGDWVVTPRSGKAVEIQALWYNAQMIFALLLEKNGQLRDRDLVNLSAEKTKISFHERFWNSQKNYLYDVIDENNVADDSLRPNQLFAISLPFPLLDDERSKAVLAIIERELYTPVGLRTLPVNDKRYIGKYGGDQWHRDSSYHQGTAWSWLLGPYVDALCKIEDRSKAKEVIEAFKYHLEEACIGSVSEIFDADAPFHPRGCVAQAWGVAEILRTIQENHLQ